MVKKLNVLLPPAFVPLQELRAYGDMSTFGVDVRKEHAAAGVTLIDSPTFGKDTADKRLIVDCCYFAFTMPQPAVVLISNDRDYLALLSKLHTLNIPVCLISESAFTNVYGKKLARHFVEWTDVKGSRSPPPPIVQPAKESKAVKDVKLVNIAQPIAVPKKPDAFDLAFEKEQEEARMVLARLETYPLPTMRVEIDHIIAPAYEPLLAILSTQPGLSEKLIRAKYTKKTVPKALESIISKAVRSNHLSKAKKGSKATYTVHPRVQHALHLANRPLAYQQMRHIMQQFEALHIAPSGFQLTVVLKNSAAGKQKGLLAMEEPSLLLNEAIKDKILAKIDSRKTGDVFRLLSPPKAAAIEPISRAKLVTPAKESSTAAELAAASKIVLAEFVAGMTSVNVTPFSLPHLPAAFRWRQSHVKTAQYVTAVGDIGYPGYLRFQDPVASVTPKLEPLVKCLQLYSKRGLQPNAQVLSSLLMKAYGMKRPHLKLDWAGAIRKQLRLEDALQAIRVLPGSPAPLSDYVLDLVERFREPAEQQTEDSIQSSSIATAESATVCGPLYSDDAEKVIFWREYRRHLTKVKDMFEAELEAGKTTHKKLTKAQGKYGSRQIGFYTHFLRFLDFRPYQGKLFGTEESSTTVPNRLKPFIRVIQLWQQNTDDALINVYLLGRLIFGAYVSKVDRGVFTSNTTRLGQTLLDEAIFAKLIRVESIRDKRSWCRIRLADELVESRPASAMSSTGKESDPVLVVQEQSSGDTNNMAFQEDVVAAQMLDEESDVERESTIPEEPEMEMLDAPDIEIMGIPRIEMLDAPQEEVADDPSVQQAQLSSAPEPDLEAASNAPAEEVEAAAIDQVQVESDADQVLDGSCQASNEPEEVDLGRLTEEQRAVFNRLSSTKGNTTF